MTVYRGIKVERPAGSFYRAANESEGADINEDLYFSGISTLVIIRTDAASPGPFLDQWRAHGAGGLDDSQDIGTAQGITIFRQSRNGGATVSEALKDVLRAGEFRDKRKGDLQALITWHRDNEDKARIILTAPDESWPASYREPLWPLAGLAGSFPGIKAMRSPRLHILAKQGAHSMKKIALVAAPIALLGYIVKRRL